MGRKSRADLISELKTAGAKGSLSKMNRTKLTEMHAQMIPGGGSAGQLPSVAPIAGSVKTEVVAETGSGQRPSTAPSRLRIDPDEDDITDYLGVPGIGEFEGLEGVTDLSWRETKTASSLLYRPPPPPLCIVLGGDRLG